MLVGESLCVWYLVPDMRVRESRSTNSGGHGIHASTFDPVASGGIQASVSRERVPRNRIWVWQL